MVKCFNELPSDLFVFYTILSPNGSKHKIDILYKRNTATCFNEKYFCCTYTNSYTY